MAIKGGDTSALRAFNERLILSTIRSRGPLSRAELGRATGLSAQAAADISRRLIAAGLLVERDRVRGGLGQPKVPLALNPEGAFSLGVKIGRRSLEVQLCDLTGAARAAWQRGYDAPLPAPCLELAQTGIAAVLDGLDASARARIVGLGVAMPGRMQLWEAEMGVAPGSLAGWAGLDIAARLQAATGFETRICNDAHAACAAELARPGSPLAGRTALYLYLATFIGGAVVLEGRLLTGGHGGAGAAGSMPLGPLAPPGAEGDGSPTLIGLASLVRLGRDLAGEGHDHEAIFAGAPRNAGAEAVFARWCAPAAAGIARAAAAAAALLEIDMLVLDGVLPAPWLETLSGAVRRAVAGLELKGLEAFEIRSGGLGPAARVTGAAQLPMSGRFVPDVRTLVQVPDRAAPRSGNNSETNL